MDCVEVQNMKRSLQQGYHSLGSVVIANSLTHECIVYITVNVAYKDEATLDVIWVFLSKLQNIARGHSVIPVYDISLVSC